MGTSAINCHNRTDLIDGTPEGLSVGAIDGGEEGCSVTISDGIPLGGMEGLVCQCEIHVAIHIADKVITKPLLTSLLGQK